MNGPVDVKVEWSKSEFSRTRSSNVYTTVAKFCEDAEGWPHEGWSVVLEFAGADERSDKAKARFLMPNAPWERLKRGCVFELYEGSERTAVVTVL